uniref:G-protein coupled receptors family 1 profile domain-containing protein n=1 Tax=Globodera rostochiensis TaxID=31243 RepID=A0A914H448_GLORO
MDLPAAAAGAALGPNSSANFSSADSPNECFDMNDYYWESRHDLTTRPAVMRTFAGLYATIILLGVVGNACVVIAIARIKSLQTVPNMFIFSLSCSDILVCCISATITPISAFRKDWVFGQFFCSTAPFIAGVSLCFSTFSLAAISVDRFMLIIFPTRKAFSHGQALFVIMTICLLASAFSLPMIFMQKLRHYDNFCGEFCFEDWGQNIGIRRIYGTLLLTVQFIIPLALIIFCYTAISVRLGKSVNFRNKKTCEWQMPVSAQRNAATKRRQRTNRMFIAMVIAFSLSWVWSVLYNLLRDYECLPPLVTRQEFFFGILTHCIAMSSTVWNPILYALLNLQLRAAFIQLIPECIKRVLIQLCGRKKNQQQQKQRTSAAEKSRLLGIQTGGREAGGGTKKVLTCFLSSRGSVELSTSSDSRHNVSAEPAGMNGRTTPAATAAVEKALKLKKVQHQQKNGATLPSELADSRLGSRAETETTMVSGGVETKQRLRLVQCEENDQRREEAEATADGADIKELDTDEHI